jgi:hypothetical protein
MNDGTGHDMERGDDALPASDPKQARSIAFSWRGKVPKLRHTCCIGKYVS